MGRMQTFLLGAATLFQRAEDRNEDQHRRIRRDLGQLEEWIRNLRSRGDLVRFRAPIVQDFLLGLIGGSFWPREGAVIGERTPRPALEDESIKWPPSVGSYDGQGLVTAIGEMATLGFALTYEEVRAFLVGLTQAAPLSASGLSQIGLVARSLVTEVAASSFTLAEYRSAWRKLFSPPPNIQLPPPTISLANSAPPSVGPTSSTGIATIAARSDHTHGHGDQAGGTLHATATPAVAGFMSPADKGKLDGVAPGATATPLAATPPPSIAPASSTGTALDAARGDHTHSHGDQAGGTLHAIATPAVSGFMSAPDKTKLDSVAPGATATPLAAAPPPSIAPASSTGTALDAARGDHTHSHGDQAGGTLHAIATPAVAGFLSAADKSKLDSLAPGSSSHLQSIQLCASKTNLLLPNSTFGVDGQVELFALNAVPDVCTKAGTLSDWWVEGQFSPNVNVTITILRAPATGGLPSTTPVTLVVPVGQFSASSAATLAVPAGERITASSNALWNHNGLVLRARIKS